jgi:hypothetical protein
MPYPKPKQLIIFIWEIIILHLSFIFKSLHSPLPILLINKFIYIILFIKLHYKNIIPSFSKD